MSLSDYHTAIVTGASSGIGAAVAVDLAERGIEVHAVARRKERLEELSSKTGCNIHVLDVRNSKQIYDTLSSLEVGILVNNAGLGRGFDALYKVNPDDIETTIDTNVKAVYHLLRAVLPGMVEQKRGHVVNVGSMAILYALDAQWHVNVNLIELQPTEQTYGGIQFVPVD